MLNQSTINKVLLLGKIVKEPKWHADAGEMVLSFTIVTTEKVRKNAQYLKHDEYHEIRATSSAIEDETQLRSGEMVYVQGRIQTKQFIDEAQIRRYKTEVVALSVDVINTPEAEPLPSQAHR